MKQLRNSFKAYAELTKDKLGRPVPKETPGKIKLAHIAPYLVLKQRVEELEATSNFQQLVSDYLEFFRNKVPGIFSPAQGDAEADSDPILRVFDASIMSRLPEFFRRSGFYLDVFNGEHVNWENYFDLLVTATRHREVKITRLWLCSEHFPEKRIDFGSFQIQNYSAKQLDASVNNQINKHFYPEAFIDSKRLSGHWFVKEESRIVREGVMSMEEILEQRTGAFSSWAYFEPGLEPIEREFPARALQLLSLGDWTDWEDGLEFFQIPFAMHVDDDVLAKPTPLAWTESPTDSISESEWSTSLSTGQLNELRRRVHLAQEVLDTIDLEKYEWQFITIALGYLGKAFLTENRLDQLLWYTVVLESLFGEKQPASSGVMETLRRRLAAVLAKTEKARKELRSGFTKLYEFRSDLVHGNRSSRQATATHLAEARRLARQALLWFFKYLHSIHAEMLQLKVPPEKYPTRDELLMAIDLDDKSSERLRVLLNLQSNQRKNTIN